MKAGTDGVTCRRVLARLSLISALDGATLIKSEWANRACDHATGNFDAVQPRQMIDSCNSFDEFVYWSAIDWSSERQWMHRIIYSGMTMLFSARVFSSRERRDYRVCCTPSYYLSTFFWLHFSCVCVCAASTVGNPLLILPRVKIHLYFCAVSPTPFDRLHNKLNCTVSFVYINVA